MYELKTTSVSARFYSWIWKTEITKFKTMCPYFWKYILTVLFLPLILVAKVLAYFIPAKNKINKGFDYVSDSKLGQTVSTLTSPSRFWDTIGSVLKWLFIIVMSSLALSLIGIIIYELYTNTLKALAFIGGMSIMILLLTLLIYLFSEKNLGQILLSPFKLIGNMVYSLYKKVCPLIKWE